MTPEQKIRRIWSKIPEVACKGHCAQGCTSFGIDYLERKLIADRYGVDMPTDWEKAKQRIRAGEDVRCPALTDDNRCSVHDVRPTVCRLFGTTEDLPCPWGCEVEGGALPLGVGFGLLTETIAVGDAAEPSAPSPVSRRQRRHPGRR